MVTYFNKKDLVNFGKYLLSEDRSKSFQAINDLPKEKGFNPLSAEERLKDVHHSDVSNWLEMRDEGVVYLLTRVTKDHEFEFVKPYKSLEALLEIRHLTDLYQEIRNHLDKYQVYWFKGALDANYGISRSNVEV